MTATPAPTSTPTPVGGVAACVPFVAVPPDAPEGAARADAPVVLTWHLMDPPCTERAMAAALPLAGLGAWRIHLGLPMCGSRLPDGGADEVMRLGYEDAVMNLHGPIVTQAAAELPAALDALRARFGLGASTIGLVGGSTGSAVAARVALEAAPSAGIDVAALVLVSPVAELRAAVDATARQYGFEYTWHPAAIEVARRLDVVARAADLVAAGQPAVRLVVGADDDRAGFLDPAERLRAALAAAYDDAGRVDVVVVDGMGHALADPPGDEPAPQTPSAAAVDRLAVDWLRRHLVDR